MIRSGADKKSDKIDDLAEGTVIVALATTEVGDTTRVQFDRGWVSVTAGSGKVLLELVATPADDVPAPSPLADIDPLAAMGLLSGFGAPAPVIPSALAGGGSSFFMNAPASAPVIAGGDFNFDFISAPAPASAPADATGGSSMSLEEMLAAQHSDTAAALAAATQPNTAATQDATAAVFFY